MDRLHHLGLRLDGIMVEIEFGKLRLILVHHDLSHPFPHTFPVVFELYFDFYVFYPLTIARFRESPVNVIIDTKTTRFGATILTK